MATRWLGQLQRNPSFSERLNAGLGRGLQQGQQMLQEYQQKQAAKALGIPENLSPDLQKTLLAGNLQNQGKLSLLQKKQEMLQGLFGGSSETPNVGQQLQQGSPSENPQPSSGSQPQGFNPASLSDADILKLSLIDPTAGNAARAMKDTATKEARAQKEFEQRQNLEERKFQTRKEEEKERKRLEREKELRQETLPIRKEIVERAQSARTSIENKEKLVNLIDTGNLNDPTYAAFAEALPLDLGKRLLSPETVEYKAGLIDEYKDLKTLFSGATRVKELEILEAKVADLYLTDAQKKAVLKSRINANKADLIREEAALELEKEGKSYGMLEYRQKVEEKAKPKLDALFNRIIDEQKSIIQDAENHKGMTLDPNDPEDIQIAQQIMKEAGNDRKKARELAKKKGYVF